MRQPFDTIVLGDGVSGWTMAHVLARANQSVAVVGLGTARFHVGEYLPPEGCLAVEALALRAVLDDASHRLSPGVVSIWGSAHRAFTSVMARPGGRALCLDRQRLNEAMRHAATEAGAEYTTLTSEVSHQSNGWTLATEAGALSARVLVDATGRAARGAQATGAKTFRHDDLIALASVFNEAPCRDAQLLIESLANGWCYAAALSEDRQIAVFLSDGNLIPRRNAERTDFAQARLAATKMISARLATARLDRLHTVPAWSQMTEPSAGPNWVAIGDAAMAFDPLGSAGLTKAMRDIAETSAILLNGVPTDLHTLNDIRRRRYKAYLRSLTDTYLVEQRYGTPFWQRRTAL